MLVILSRIRLRRGRYSSAGSCSTERCTQIMTTCYGRTAYYAVKDGVTEVNIEARLLLPSQDFLREKTVGFIFDCIKTGQEADLPPDPIVRLGPSGDYVAIDGHNLIAVRACLGQSIDVHVASSAKDGLPAINDMNVDRNANLRIKFDSVLDMRAVVERLGIFSFDDLIRRYPEIFPLKST